MIPTLVSIKNGVVDNIVICKDGDELERLFIAENEAYGRETNEDEMTDGYVELEDMTICMAWAWASAAEYEAEKAS